jgi:sterol desaturase/sphingolipid hydroxylase (fatty acid hydroxylase superfamily)
MLLEGVLLMIIHKNKNIVSIKGGAVSMISGGFTFGLMFLANLALYFTIYTKAYQLRLFQGGFQWYYWLLCFLIYDLMFYTAHRLGHEVRLIWCFHSVHHTSEEMRLTSAIRGSAFDFIYYPWFFVWIPFLGFHPLMLFIVESFSRLYGVLTHVSPLWFGKIRWLDHILITPSVHRVHHGRNTRYLDKNYSEVLSIWDKMFGTFIQEDETPDYGILKPIDSNNLKEIQLSPWQDLWNDIKKSPNLRTALKYIFYPPGWSHDGPLTTAKVLQDQLKGK